MGKNQKKKTLGIIPKQPIPGLPPGMADPNTNIAARIIITAYTDGRPPGVICTVSPLDSLALLEIGLKEARKALMPLEPQTQGKAQADPQDKPRAFLGPRETIIYPSSEPDKEP